MSDVASRPAPTRGRGTTRGRGGFRGGARTRQTNGDSRESPSDETDQGELGDLKRKYSGQLKSLKELFAEWSDVDLLLALQETDGDLERAIDNISEGKVSQFSDVKKNTKDRSRSKVPEAQADAGSRPARGRGGAVDSGRGGRGRTERGRGAPRAGRGGQHASDSRGLTSPTAIATESATWGDSSWDAPASTPAASTPAVEAPKPASSASAAPAQKTWASMFAKPKVEARSAQPPAAEPTPTQEAGAVPSSDISSGYVEVTHSDADTETAPQLGESVTSQETSEVLENPTIAIDDSNIAIPPTTDKLTEDNVETLPDVSQPAPVGTAASEVESSRGADSTAVSVVAQPIQVPIGRPALGGFATTALKATSNQGRSASFQRRLQEQQEAVVMPGNHAVDRAAVQFGSLGLNGESSLDVDEDREELETRAQPPQHSPVAQPKTALPPAPRQETTAQEQTIKPAPGLPIPSAQQSSAQQAGASQYGQSTGQAQGGNGGYNQFGRYGQHQDAATQKQNYDPFGHQAQQAPYDAYSAQSQGPSHSQQATASQGGFPSANNDYYTSEQQRNAYQAYYGYGQQAASQQDAGAAQPRTGSAFGAGNESSFAATQSQQTPGRFGETQSGSTPASTASGAQHQATAGQAQHHGHGQQQSYPYNHPYYNQPYYQAYMNQNYGYGQQQQQGFGAPFGKGGMYGHPQQGGYGAPQSGYDQHSASPAQAGSFGRESALGAGLNSEYSRSGSTQPGQSQAAAGGYGGDAFGRSPGSYAGQTQQYGQQSGNEDSLKPFGDKGTNASNNGLSQPGRPTSATNSNQPGQGLPPPQSHQGGYGGYPSQFQGGAQASQYGGAGLGGLGGAGQSHQQQGGYSGYQSQGGFGNNYQQYGQQGQQRGGWGGNYGH